MGWAHIIKAEIVKKKGKWNEVFQILDYIILSILQAYKPLILDCRGEPCNIVAINSKSLKQVLILIHLLMTIPHIFNFEVSPTLVLQTC